MQALIVVDAQNEFSAEGLRPVRNYDDAIARIKDHVENARMHGWPIAWIRHHNRPDESRAFVPGSWGAELSPGLGPDASRSDETLFEKDVFGAFTGTELEHWLKVRGVTAITLAGFYTHMCVSTSAREALVRGFGVSLDPEATGACDLHSDTLGSQSAEEVRRTALLQLSNMGAAIIQGERQAARSAR